MSTTIASLRSAARTALAAHSLRLDDVWGGQPPYVVMFNGGTDFTEMYTRDGKQVRMGFRLTLVESKATEALSNTAMGTDVVNLVAAAIAMHVRLDGLSPDQVRDVAGVSHWTADLNVSALVTIP